MKRFALMAGALMLVATFVSGESFAAPPLRVSPAINVQVAGTPAATVGYRRYPRAYRYNYGPRYGYGYGPGYRANYYRGSRYAPNYYYGPGYGAYYRGPVGAVNVYPGGVNVGGVHVGY